MNDMDARWLAAHDWSAEPVDVCWLDCDQPGYLKTWRSRSGPRKHWRNYEIVLCVPHAKVLEAGAYDGSYIGAPPPPDSAAVSWPWQVQAEPLVSVV
jgi:hypothetical protein